MDTSQYNESVLGDKVMDTSQYNESVLGDKVMDTSQYKSVTGGHGDGHVTI
jgi:hypothetical protein